VKKIVVLMMMTMFVAGVAVAADIQTGVEAARAAVAELSKALKGELGQAVEKEGPAGAIHACAGSAWRVRQRVSKELGADIYRKSLKARNPANAPDAWEKMVLEEFERRKAAGEPVENLEYALETQIDGKPVLRYMKAIPTGQVCVECHGRWVPEDVEKALAEAYPNDQARGFEVGDIRGVFSITQPLKRN